MTKEEMLMKPYKKGAKPQDVILSGDAVLKLMEEYSQQQNKQLIEFVKKASKMHCDDDLWTIKQDAEELMYWF